MNFLNLKYHYFINVRLHVHVGKIKLQRRIECASESCIVLKIIPISDPQLRESTLSTHPTHAIFRFQFHLLHTSRLRMKYNYTPMSTSLYPLSIHIPMGGYWITMGMVIQYHTHCSTLVCI